MRRGFSFAFVLATLAGCRSKPATEIVVGASTQMTRELRAVRIVARSQDGALTCKTVDLEREGALADVVRVSGASGETASVTAAGYVERASTLGGDDCAIVGTPRVVRRHQTRFVDGESLYLGMPLRRLCAGVSCAEGQTCLGGACASDAVDSAKLVTFSDALVRGDTSFCVSPAGCFEDVVPALVSNDQDCTFQLPDWAKLDDHMNIELLHDDLSREILDVDPVEGFTRLGPSHFRIAPNLCARYRSRHIAALYVGANCNPKSPLAPICGRAEHDAGVAERTLCTSAETLLPARAAIYALLDQSRSMAEAFGPTGLSEPFDLALRWELHKRTILGVGTMPGSAAACSGPSNPFAVPAAPLAPVDRAGDALRARTSPGATLVPDGPLYVDGALRDNGAYAVLGAVSPADFPLRHLLLVGNRDFGPHCAPPLGTTGELAYAAFRDRGISTSALVVRAPPEAPAFGRDVYVDALAATRAGSGVFADGVADEAARRLAVVTTFAALGSCLYDLPDAIVPGQELSGVKVSYFDLIASQRVDLDHERACSATSSAPGWNLEGRRVRLCGKACNDLRLMLVLSAQYAVDRHFVPVDVPLKWAEPCRP